MARTQRRRSRELDWCSQWSGCPVSSPTSASNSCRIRSPPFPAPWAWGADAGALAIKALAATGSRAGLEALFGKAGGVAGVIGAVTGVIDFAKTLEGGNLADSTVTGLNAAAGVLLLIPGGQVAGVALAVAAFALKAIIGDHRAEDAEHSSEADAKAFLLKEGLSEDFAKVFSNLNDQKQNIGPFVQQVAEKLGLTQKQLFEKLNPSTGEDRTQLLTKFATLSQGEELIESFGDSKFPVFGPPLTIDSPDVKPLIEIFGKGDVRKIIEKVNAARDDFAGKVADDIGPLLD